MSDAEPSELLQRLFHAIDDPTARDQVEALLRVCLRALVDVSELDQDLYRLAKDSGKAPAAMRNAGPLLRALADRRLLGARRLEALLRERWGLAAAPTSDELEFDIDFDPDGGELAARGGAGLVEGEIELALGSLGRAEGGGDQRLEALREACLPFGRTLAAQLEKFDRFFGVACERQDHELALRQLDENCSSLGDGIFGFVAEACERFLGPIERGGIMPGRRGALDKALLVRRELAKLRRVVGACNARVQSLATPPKVRRMAAERLGQHVEEFVVGEAFAVLRAADRRELASLQRRLASSAGDDAVALCAACGRFLDALSAINRRGILVEHDQRLAAEICELLDAARALTQVSERGAAQLIKDAYVKAHRLYGRDERLDELLAQWRVPPEDLAQPARIEASAAQLSALLNS